MQGVRWLFFDLGNTLISEQAAVDRRVRQIVSSFERYGRRVSVEDVTITLRDAWGSFHPRPIARAIEMLADDRKIRQLIEAEAGYPKELEKPYEGAKPALQALAPRYRIGVIANQSAGTEARGHRLQPVQGGVHWHSANLAIDPMAPSPQRVGPRPGR